MTVSESIIKWLKTFDPEEYQKMKHIDTDIMHGNVNYSLVKAPTESVKHFLSGASVHKEYYQFQARLSTLTNAECIDNGAWLEALTKWIGEKVSAGDLPVIEGATVRQMGIPTSFHVSSNGQGESVYQMTIFIEYYKKGA